MKVSECCGAAPKVYGDYDSDSEDWGVCSKCGEHCEYIDDGEDEE